MTTDTLVAGADTTQSGDAASADGATTTANPADVTSTTTPTAADKTAGKADDTKSDATAADAAIEYDFKAPDGVELDKARLDEFTAFAKEAKLPKDVAQKIVDLEVKNQQAQANAHIAMVEGWANEVKADKEIGGDKLAENLAIAKKAIDLGPPELKSLLNSSGMGNHPAVVKWAVTVGKALSEDRFVKGTHAPAASEKSRADRLYPSTASA